MGLPDQLHIHEPGQSLEGDREDEGAHGEPSRRRVRYLDPNHTLSGECPLSLGLLGCVRRQEPRGLPTDLSAGERDDIEMIKVNLRLISRTINMGVADKLAASETTR